MRKQDFRLRIRAAADWYLPRGWWPVFATHTYDDQALTAADWAERPDAPWYRILRGSGWTAYVKRVAEAVRLEAGLPKGTPRSELVAYASVLEHGDQRGRVHSHTVLFLRECPEDWRLPSVRGDGYVALTVPDAIWPVLDLGKALHLPCRSAGDDVWARHGAAWPTVWSFSEEEGLTAKAAPLAGAAGVAAYLGNYLDQAGAFAGANSLDASNGFGREALRKAVRACPASFLRPLCALSVSDAAEYLREDCDLAMEAVMREARSERERRCYAAHPGWVQRLMMRYRPRSIGRAIHAAFEAREDGVADRGRDYAVAAAMSEAAEAADVMGDAMLASGELDTGCSEDRSGRAAGWLAAALPGAVRPDIPALPNPLEPVRPALEGAPVAGAPGRRLSRTLGAEHPGETPLRALARETLSLVPPETVS